MIDQRSGMREWISFGGFETDGKKKEM